MPIANHLPKNTRKPSLQRSSWSNTRLRRKAQPHEERAEYWFEYFHQLLQGPAAILRINLDGLVEHEVKARYIRNGETTSHARDRQLRKLTAMQCALEAFGEDQLASFSNEVLRVLVQAQADTWRSSPF